MTPRSTLLSASLAALSMTMPAMAADIDVEVQNLTQGIYFTPLLIVAHSPETSLFEPGEAASTELQSMAEGGEIAPLMTLGDSIGADMAANPAGGLLTPGAMTSAMLTPADGNTVLRLKPSVYR